MKMKHRRKDAMASRRQKLGCATMPGLRELAATACLAGLHTAAFGAGPAALPVPCAGTSSCSGQVFDPLKTHSLLPSGVAQIVTTGNQLTVNQGSASSAIFNWSSFNIAKGYTVQFTQPSASAVALNRIFDPSVTQISGNLKANGQIYLINPNGILFGNGAVVDVGGLIASTLDVANSRIIGGLLSDPLRTDPVFSSNAAVTGSALQASAGANPSIQVQAGASIYAAGRDQSGTVVSAGRVFLFAPTLENAGKITVDGGGQVILAAGSNVYLGSSTEPSLRGLLVEVTGSNAAGVTIDATGTISVARGNITLMGLAVSQAGSLTATSALDANGSIDLIAREADPTVSSIDPSVLFGAAATGTVNLASGSQTRVVLDPTDTATAPLNDPTAASLRSTINIQGVAVNIGGAGTAGSTVIEAHGGDINVTARAAVSSLPSSGGVAYQIGAGDILGANNAAAVINVGSDVTIDASGLQNVAVNGARNFVYIDRLTSNNLANAPYQRTGFLLGQSLYVNLANAPSWLDVSNLQSAVAGTQAERNATAGTVSLNAEGAVHLAAGSTVNVSGGSVNVSAAIGRTSELITASGQVVNIAKASPDSQYVGFADQGSRTLVSSTEGIKQTYTWQSPSYSAVGGYIAGTNAGTLRIYAPAALLGGTLLGQTTVAPQQRSNEPLGGMLQIGSANPANLDSEAGINRAGIVLTFDITTGAQLLSGMETVAPIVLETGALRSGGFTRLDLTSDGAIVLAPGSALNLGPGGSLALRANAIAIDASISAPSGSIVMTERPLTALPGGDNAYADISAQRDYLNLLTNASLRGSVAFSPGTNLSAAGLWTNDRIDSPTAVPAEPLSVNGGSIVISGRNVDVSGAGFDVSAGASLSQPGAFQGGNAGSLSLTGTYAVPGAIANVDTGVLNLGSDFASRIAGYGVAAGGTLSIGAPSITIGTSASASAVTLDPSIGAAGFQNFHFSGYNSLTMAAGTAFVPTMQTFQDSPSLNAAASAALLGSVASPQTRFPGNVLASNLTLTSSNSVIGTVDIGSGALLDAGALGSIGITAGQSVLINGSLRAQGGSISATLGPAPTTIGVTLSMFDGRSIVVGGGANLDVSGTSLVLANSQGIRAGNVINGGSITLNAPIGTVDIAAGVNVLAQGTTDLVDIPVSGGGTQRQWIASSGGTVDLVGSIGLIIEGNFQAQGGLPTAPGGTLSAMLVSAPGIFGTPGALPANIEAQLTQAMNLKVTSALPAQPASFASTANQGYVSPSVISNSGFDQVWLQSPNTISFDPAASGALTLSARNAIVLAAPVLLANNGAAVQVNAPYVVMGPAELLSAATYNNGHSFQAPQAASSGAGSFTVNAGQIDLVGTLSLQASSQASLNASADVQAIGTSLLSNPNSRTSGALQFAGNVAIDAAQVYPSTQTDYAFLGSAGAAPSTLSVVASAGSVALAPLSAGGSLSFNVGSMDVSGRVLAPLGTINVNLPGTFTLESTGLLSVASSGLVPFGTVLNANEWTYGIPANNGNNPVAPYVLASQSGVTVVPKSINISAGTLNASPGSTMSVAGGGDVLGTGFVAGPGGSYDMSLNFPYPAAPTTANPYFALIPARGSAGVQFDTQIFNDLVLNTGLTNIGAAGASIGHTITIAGGGGITAGTYTILPARYALLPGAYAVEAVSGYQDIAPGATVSMADGTAIVAGKLGFAGAGTVNSRWSGFRVYSSTQFQTLSEFQNFTGSAFFGTIAAEISQPLPRVGIDAGVLQLAAPSMLLAGSIEAQPSASGRGAEIAIDAPAIVVADIATGSAATMPSGTLTLDAAALTRLGAETLVLGAQDNRGFVVSPTTGQTESALTLSTPIPVASVSVQALSPLSAGELILAAQDISVASGARLVASSAVPPTAALQTTGNGALLYIGNAPQIPAYVRTGASTAGTSSVGNLAVGNNVQISGKSAIFDSTDNQIFGSAVAISAGAVDFSAALVNLGNTPAGANGLDLTAALGGLSGTRSLTVTSLGGINVYGSASVGSLAPSGNPALQNLVLSGPGIAGFAGGETSPAITFTAGQITLQNLQGAALVSAGAGGGAITLQAQSSAGSKGSIDLGGNLTLSGFQNATLTATGQQANGQTLTGTGDVQFMGVPGAADALVLAGAATNLAIGATRITSRSGVNTTLTVPGAFTLSSTGPAMAPQTQALGASLQVAAANITLNGGRIDLPAGVVSLQANGAAANDGVTLDAGSMIRVAGVTQTFASSSADASAGSIFLSTANGSISQAAGATLDISGAGTQGAAGAIQLSAVAGTVNLAGTVDLATGSQARGAQLGIDASQIANVAQIATALSGSGPLDSISLRARSGNLVVPGAGAPSLAARSIMLEADGVTGATDGSIQVSGVLDASGASGGQIALYANNQIAINAGGILDAHASAAGGSGGSVLLSARVNSNPAAPGTLDAIILATGALVDLRGGAGGTDGTISLRAPVAASGADVEIAPVAAGVISGANATKVVEAVTVDAHTGNLIVDANLLAIDAALLSNFMSSANVAAITQRLGFSTADPTFHLRPGLEIATTGTMTVSDPIDFSTGLNDIVPGDGSFTWRYGGGTLATSEPGALTLRAGGTLTIAASISDGFLYGYDNYTGLPNSTLWSGGQSWRYTITGGADLSAANPNATQAGAGDVLVGLPGLPGVTVRTGTGSIAINAGRDVALQNAAGQQDNVVYTAGLDNSANLPSVPGLPVYDAYGNFTILAPTFAQGGGDLAITAQRNVSGTTSANQYGSAQSINQWLLRKGSDTAFQPTAWWTYFDNFQQGFGALGGGNLAIVAGGDLLRVDAMVPSNGIAIGASLIQQNTGTLSVEAGGNIVQGQFYDQAGTATVQATSILNNASTNVIANSTFSRTQFAQGDNSLQITLREASKFDLPYNPTVVPASVLNASAQRTPVFFTYGASTQLSIQDASGDLAIFPVIGEANTLLSDASRGNYPMIAPIVLAAVFGGGITGPGVTTNIYQYPDVNGQVHLLADGAISNLRWTMSQANPDLLPSITLPVRPVTAAIFNPIASTTPLHALDPTQAEIVSRSNNLSSVILNLPKTSEISAGGNIGPYVSIDIQNSNADRLSSVLAAGRITMLSGTPFDHIYIAGQGAAQIIAGGSINLGPDGGGIDSRGNLDNLNLPAQGASLIVAAGAGTTGGAGGILSAAVPDYLNVIVNFIRYDAFASSGANSSNLDSQVVASLASDPSLAPLVTALNLGLANRGSVDNPASALHLSLAQLTPAVLAKGAVALASDIQVVANQQFVASSNTETFAPAYAAFGDLFPNLSASQNAVRNFVLANPFANASNAAALQVSALQGLPANFVNVLNLGLSSPASVNDPQSPFSQAMAAIEPATLSADARQLLANVLTTAGTSREQLQASGLLSGNGSPYAKALTALADAFTPATPAGANDLQMDYSQIKAEQTGSLAVLAPQGGVVVGQSSAPALDNFAKNKTAAQLGIFTLGGGDILGMARDNFDVFRSRVFTVAGGDIKLWSSQGNIDAGRGPRDVAVAAPPQIRTDPNTGVQFLDFSASVSGSGIGALDTVSGQAPSNINLMAPAGYIDAGEAGIRAQTGTVILGTNLVLNGSNIQAASGVSGGAVVAAPPPPVPTSTNTSAGDKAASDAQREALASALDEQRNGAQLRVRVSGEFLGFEKDCGSGERSECKDKSEGAKK